MESNFRKLDIWKLGMEICEVVYAVTKQFPKDELYALVSQMRRAAISIPSNIAEGYARRQKGEKRQFINVASASNAELESQVELSKRLGYLDDSNYAALLEKIDHEFRMITNFLKSIG